MSDVVREAEAFLAAHWPATDPRAWIELVIDERWAALRWPSASFGRDLSDDDAREVEAFLGPYLAGEVHRPLRASLQRFAEKHNVTL